MDIEEILYTFEDDYNPSSMVPGPRNMYNQGQLVQPNADGSRPGYNGDNVRKLRSGVEVSSKKTKVFKYPRKNFKGEINYYKTPQITRAGIEGVPENVGTKLARPKDGKSFQILHYPDGIENKPKLSLFKTEKQAVDFYNKNVKRGSGAQVKDTFDKQSKEFKDFFKDPKIYRRYYDGPLNASSIDKIWLNLSSENKRQAKELLGTQDKNIKEAKELTKKGYIKVTDLAGELDRSPDEVLRSMKTSKKFNKLFPNYLDGLKTASNGTKWIKTTPSTLTKLKQWADDPQSKGLSEKTIKNVQTAYDDKKLMDYWKKWKPGTPIDQELVDSVHGKKGSANTMMQLGRTLQGKEAIDGVKKNKFLGDKIIEAVRYKSKEFGDWHTAAYKYAKQDMDTFLPPGKSGTTFGDYQRLLTKSLKEVGLEDFQVDEINALRAGVRGGTQPYSVFTNILKGKYNQGEKRRFDAENAKNQMKLNTALAMGDDETITVSKKKMNKKEYIDYVLKLQNDQVDNFFKKVPELKGKISLPKFDLRDPRTVYGARFNTFDPTLQNAILKNFEEIGFTIDVGKKAKTQKELLRSNLLKFAGTITDKCNIDFKAKAEGGRIGFSTGSEDCLRIAKEGLEEGLKNGFKKGNQQVLAEGILKSGKFFKDALSLRGLLGPAALAFTAAAEAGIVGYDMLSSGKSFREAIGDSVFNYALGDKTKIDSEKEFIKRLKNIKVGPQGYQRMGDAEIGKMLQFKSNLEDMYKGFDLSNQLQNVDQAILDNKASQDGTQMFPDTAFQLDAEKDRLQADIQDYNRVGTPRKVTDYFLSDKGTKGADASALADLLVRQDQLKDAGKFLPSLSGDKRRDRERKEISYGIENLLNPPKLDEFGEYFVSRPQSEQSYIMGLGYKEGGIASLNVKK